MFKSRVKKIVIIVIVLVGLFDMLFSCYAADDIGQVRISLDRINDSLKQSIIPSIDGLPVIGDKLGAVTDMHADYHKENQRITLESGQVKVVLQFIGQGIQAVEEGIALDVANADQFHVVASITAPDVQMDPENNEICIATGYPGTKTLYMAFTLLASEDSFLISEMGQAISTSLNDAYMMLVNGANKLPQEYKSADMTLLPKTLKAQPVKKGMLLEKTAGEQLDAMLEQAYLEGLRDFTIVSTYRTFQEQKRLFDNKVVYYKKRMKSGYIEEAAKTVAIPGTSEHQIGLAVDIGCKSAGVVEAFAYTTQGHWLASNSWRYGYILRYQKNKTDTTGIIYEPWHFRYVGYPHAKYMYENGLALEEYLSYIAENGFIAMQEGSGIYVVSSEQGQIGTAYFQGKANSVAMRQIKKAAGPLIRQRIPAVFIIRLDLI